MEFAREQVSKSLFGVNRICQLVGISKTTYYQNENPTARFEKKYLNIKSFVSEIIENNSEYGIKRIKAELEDEYKTTIGRDTLGKLLKLWRLSLKRKIKNNGPNMIQKILLSLAGRANLLIRTKITKPFQALSSDITELNYKGGKAYLCVHKDVLGQMVYGYALGLNMETNLVMKSLKMAIITISKLAGKLIHKLIIHQDRGSQYTSHQYVQTVLGFATISYSDPGTPTHNPGQESFFGRFKDDWKDEIAEIETFEKLQKFVDKKIKRYNCERRHTSIGLVSPWKFTKSFLKTNS